ncbi:CG30338 [Drosophila busckii]|uniref:CG30338 n=1 Tax=Drosophila busckii TaxID=30019 RepID=A0A0M4ET98_DROBS|nr:CG30338 [Drosophila busckii]
MDAHIYPRCLNHQLEEFELLSSIYCAPGELQLLDAGVVADFSELLKQEPIVSVERLSSHLEYIIKLSLSGRRSVDVRIELPHLYPLLELAKISVHTTLLDKAKQQHLKQQTEEFLEQQRDTEQPYIYQLLSWLQEQIEALMQRALSSAESSLVEEQQQQQQLGKTCALERHWIYLHHLKSSDKRQEIVRLARHLHLSGFSRPGKPAIICVEGAPEQLHEYYRSIKGLHFQKISLVRIEQQQRKRRFDGFQEQLFNDSEQPSQDNIMSMSQFIKFLESHNSGYMKALLFSLAKQNC